jgi:hypothetical protein
MKNMQDLINLVIKILSKLNHIDMDISISIIINMNNF